jgi:hypothetical protein
MNDIKRKNIRLALVFLIVPVIMFFVMLHWAALIYPDMMPGL